MDFSFPLFLGEREIQEIHPDKRNHHTNDCIEYPAAHPCHILDFFTRRSSRRADDNTRDGEPDSVNQHSEKSLERSLVEGDIRQDGEQQGGHLPMVIAPNERPSKNALVIV